MRARLAMAAALPLLIVPRVAPAQESDKILIESHVGERHKDADYLLSPVLLEFERRGYASISTSGALVQALHSTTGKPLSNAEAAEAKKNIVSGYEAYLSGRLEGAWDLARRGADLLFSRSATMVARQELRDELYLALVVTSLAASRLGEKPKLDESMGEFIRSFPDKEMSRQRFGPEAVKLYREMTKQIKEGGKGVLTISAGPDTMIFVNERHVGLGNQKLTLFPGRYRIYSQKGSTTGRVHRVEVEADKTTRILVDPEADAMLKTDEQMVGFLFPDEDERQRLEGPNTLEIGKAVDKREVMLIGIRPYERTLAIVATAYDVQTGQLRLSAAVPIPEGGAPSPSHLRALVAYVSGDAPAVEAPVVVLQDEREMRGAAVGSAQMRPMSAPAAQDDSGSGLHPGWRYAGWGLGAVSVGAGIYLLHIDGKGTCSNDSGGECPENYNTRVPGLALAIGGAALIVGATVLWAFEGDDDEGEAISIVPTRGGAALVIGGTL